MRPPLDSTPPSEGFPTTTTPAGTGVNDLDAVSRADIRVIGAGHRDPIDEISGRHGVDPSTPSTFFTIDSFGSAIVTAEVTGGACWAGLPDQRYVPTTGQSRRCSRMAAPSSSALPRLLSGVEAGDRDIRHPRGVGDRDGARAVI